MSQDVTQDKLAARAKSLLQAAELAAGRSDDQVVAEARRVVEQADRRLAFSGDDTVIALGGATGSGKSSLFNAISGTQLAEPGVKRPMTTSSMAAYWGSELPNDLLDWLDVPRRHVVHGDDASLDGLVLIDMPDHDSTERAHREQVDRMVTMVDMLIWVVDPQKYADAALHDRYLKPLADHSDVMMIVLNQSDRLSSEQLHSTMRDLRKLLDSEGLAQAQLVSASALTGQGIESLRQSIAAMVKSKRAAGARLSADVDTEARKLVTDIGKEQPTEIPDARVRQLNEAFADAAGVPTVADAVLGSMRHRGTLATGWPMTKWVAKLRPDPLRALHLDRTPFVREIGKSTKKIDQNELEPTAVQRTSLRPLGGVQTSRVDAALRGLAEDASVGLPAGWAKAVRNATLAHKDSLGDELDQAVATTDLAMDRGQSWWQVIRVLQWLVFVVAVAGGVWLLADMILAYMQLPPIPAPHVGAIPLPTVLLGGGALAGLLVGLLSRIGVEVGARSKANRAQRQLTKSVAAVAERLVVAPVDEELARHREALTAGVRALS